MNISCVLGKDLETYLAKFNDMKVNYDRFSPGIFEGFEGFSPIDVVEDKCQFIIATTKDNEVVGVIKFKRYKSSNHDFLSEDDFLSYKKGIKNYKGIMFVDVREDFRKMGIAKQMISHFCNITEKEGTKTAIRLGRLTSLGKDAKLLDIFREYLPGRDVKL